jgi:hypothetical protein
MGLRSPEPAACNGDPSVHLPGTPELLEPAVSDD